MGATYLFCLFLFPEELLTPIFVRNVRGRQQDRLEELLTPIFVGRWATSEPLTAKIVHQQAVGLEAAEVTAFPFRNSRGP